MDATSVRLEGGLRRILIYNFNLPAQYVDNPDLRRDVLRRVDAVVGADFRGVSANYMITASYNLLNVHTGAQHVWTGSFFLRGNAPSTISSFQPFTADFQVNAFQSLQNVETKLTWLGVETAWVFDRLESVIVNVQASVRENDPILNVRRLDQRGTVGDRRHETFFLP